MLPPGCTICEIKSVLKGDCDESRLQAQNGKELASKEATAVLQGGMIEAYLLVIMAK